VRRAIREERLRVHYQPIIDLQSGHAVAAEALLRISDPAGRMLQPESFLEVAEETGLLVELDEWVFADALRQAASWRSRFPSTELSAVSVNVTTRHLADSRFARDVIDALDGRNLPHRHLQVEVPERVLIEASRSAMTGLRALRGSGIQVGLDDFGTGYSSLAYLRQFPLDFVKMDRSFIHSLAVSAHDAAIVRAIVDLSHALGLVVVAEGVETEDQRLALNSMGCDRAQGFLFARPAEPAALDDFMVTAPTR
jgi:EAL domain-containing protein (putative c-di-GMP-specific phosphodiesterase class I)